MPPILRTVACLASLAVAALGQAPNPASAPAPAFIAADVHASPKRLHNQIQAGLHGDRYYLRNATMIDLISATYKVDPNNIFGGPAWLAFDHFDILAKVPSATSEENSLLMVRTVLSDRFKLVASPGMRPLPAFVLSAGKTPTLKKTITPAEPGGCQYQPPPQDAAPARVPTIHFSCHNTTMESFAEFLHEVASPYLNRPVVDQTGLKGGWDFDIVWTYQIPKDTDGVTIFAAVDKQLGLKLEQKTAPLPVVVVESVNETPTPNIADIDKILPPAPAAQFDVAVIRPFNPEEKHFTIDVDPSGRVTIQHASLLTLIYSSYDINPNNIMNKPKWLDSDLWDIVGKASMDSGTGPPIPGATPVLDMDEAKEMIRSLLADRFKLATHTETQPVEAYALVAAGPRMKKADPANHPDCHEGPGPDGKDPRIDNRLLNRLISCQNITMAQLADQLRILAPGYVPAPIVDETSLDGAYDFTLSFSRKGDEAKTIPAPPSPAGDSSTGAVASDPTLGGMSLFDAIQKQLGIKLEKRDKVPLPVLVIDHVDEKPTEN